MLRLKALSDQPAEAIELAVEHAPYLAMLNKEELDLTRPDDLLQSAFQICAKVGAGEGDAMPDLRHAKKAAHLAIAAADLSVSAEEVRLLQLLRNHLAIDKLTCAALELAARARHQSA